MKLGIEDNISDVYLNCGSQLLPYKFIFNHLIDHFVSVLINNRRNIANVSNRISPVKRPSSLVRTMGYQISDFNSKCQLPKPGGRRNFHTLQDLLKMSR
jgi:hypothetical protein